MFKHLTPYAGDPILGLVETFKADPRHHKTNLSIGLYLDDHGEIPVFPPIAKANQQLAQTYPNPSYLLMEGLPEFCQAVPKLMVPAQHDAITQKRIAVVQALGGSGALKLGANLLRPWFPEARVFVSDPTWDNHRGIFAGAGFEVLDYPYYDKTTLSIKFQEWCDFLRTLTPNNIILLHPCCHNPTGVDPTPEQWDELLNIIQQQKLIAFMDMAYQGFGEGFEQDAYPVRKAVDMGLSLFVSQSFSKNMSLYNERVGALSVYCADEEQAQLVLGQLKFAIRRIYSSPPAHGARLSAMVLNDPQALSEWQSEVDNMRQRINDMRHKLYQLLQEKASQFNHEHYIKQKGMFSYTGLSAEQVYQLRDQHAVYLVESGRMCVAGLNRNNVHRVADAIAEVLQSQ